MDVTQADSAANHCLPDEKMDPVEETPLTPRVGSDSGDVYVPSLKIYLICFFYYIKNELTK